MVDQQADTITLDPEASLDDGCAHHWQIATPNGVTSEGVCKRCGKSRAFLNYSQRKMMVRSVKSNGNNGNNAANSNSNSNNSNGNGNGKKTR